MKKFFLPIFIFIFVLVVYYLTSAGKTPYDYFTRLADAFIQARLYLTQNPPWLNELIPVGENKFFVVYPPMPAILSMPFVFLFKQGFQQQYLAHLLGAGIVIKTILLSLIIKKDKELAYWMGAFTGFGTIIWHLSTNGSVWYLGQLTACFFLLSALHESLSRKRSFLIGVFLGAAFLSRVHLILTLPFFFLLIKEKKKSLKEYLKLILGMVPFILFNFIYNYIRFETIYDKAYFLIPEISNEPWYQKGIFHLSYIPRHLKIIFASFPILQKEVPYILPSWNGLAIWITSPAFIYSLFAPLKEKVVKFSWLTIVLLCLIIFSHGSTGFTQFGYRFAVDFYPFLIFLTIKGVSKTKLTIYHWVLLTISILINLWGVLWINIFGWVRF